MKLIIDERAKHRMVGIAVLLSIVVVFAPAILKKSQQRFEDSISVSVSLPPKPILPRVTAREPNALFHTVKMAQADIPKVDRPKSSVSNLAKAEPLSPMLKQPVQTAKVEKNTEIAAVEITPQSQLVSALALKSKTMVDVAKPKIDIAKPMVVVSKPIAPVAKPVVAAPKSVIQSAPKVQASSATISRASKVAQSAYGVQLATFSKQSNAIALLAKLKSKGYQASYHKVIVKPGVVYYKVVVGNAKQREQAQQLQKQLAQAIQLNGFIVNKAIS
jgi:DedD protein